MSRIQVVSISFGVAVGTLGLATFLLEKSKATPNISYQFTANPQLYHSMSLITEHTESRKSASQQGPLTQQYYQQMKEAKDERTEELVFLAFKKALLRDPEKGKLEVRRAFEDLKIEDSPFEILNMAKAAAELPGMSEEVSQFFLHQTRRLRLTHPGDDYFAIQIFNAYLEDASSEDKALEESMALLKGDPSPIFRSAALASFSGRFPEAGLKLQDALGMVEKQPPSPVRNNGFQKPNTTSQVEQ